VKTELEGLSEPQPVTQDAQRALDITVTGAERIEQRVLEQNQLKRFENSGFSQKVSSTALPVVESLDRPVQLLDPPRGSEFTDPNRSLRQRNRYLVFLRRTVASLTFVLASPFLLMLIINLFSSSANFPDIYVAIVTIALGIGLVWLGVYLWKI